MIMSSHVTQNPIQIIENLFFSIFGQKEVDDFSRSLKYGLQPSWTRNFYKVSFMLYMLVTVVVLMNLLIAMMSDTYAAIQAQSDIEWKFGLSKLVRNMQKATAAPPPLNLFTSWIFYLNKKIRKFCCNRNKIRAMPASMGYQSGSKRWSIKNNRTHSIRHKDSVAFAGFGITPLGSQAQIEYATRIDKVLDWEVVRKKYRMLFGDEMEKPSEVEVPDTTDDLDQRDQSNEVK